MLLHLKIKAGHDTLRSWTGGRDDIRDKGGQEARTKQSKSGALASVFISDLKEGKCYQRKGNVIQMLVKISH